MKKKYLLSFVIVLWVLSIVAFVFTLYNRIEGLCLNEEGCHYLFDCTPEEFFDKEFEFYKYVGDLRGNSYVDGDGRLNLMFSPKQKKAFRESEWLTGFEELDDKSNIVLSADLQSITFYSYSETYDEDVELLYHVLYKLSAIQLLDGTPQQDICIYLTEIDAVTGETTFSGDVRFDRD